MTPQIGLMELVVLWCRGSKFADLMKKASVFEGSVIRCIRRLDELVLSLHAMCKVPRPAPWPPAAAPSHPKCRATAAPTSLPRQSRPPRG